MGGAVLRHLVADGVEVRALARSEAAADVVADLGATPVRGELSDRRRLRVAMAGSDVVYHVAGVNAMCLRRANAMFLTNVAGTRDVVTAAAEADVCRVVVTSSVTAGGPITSAYARSKQLGEAAGFAAGRERGIDVVAVRPSSVQGPGRVEGSAALLLYLLRARRPLLVETSVSIVDVDDCAESHLGAARRGEPGRAYVVSSGTVAGSEIAKLLAEAVGRDVQPRVIPRAVAIVLGYPPAVLGDLWPGDTLLCREALATILTDHQHDGAPAARALGFSYRPVGVTLARAARWYERSGLI